MRPGQGEEEEAGWVEAGEPEVRLASWKSLCSWLLRLASWKSLCSWLLTMLFIALCISASMRCFSRLGMRPKRTAGRREKETGSDVFSTVRSSFITRHTVLAALAPQRHGQFSRVSVHSPSRDIPTDRHFLKRHCWQRLRLILMMVHVSFFRHFLYWMFCWMLRRKKP